MDLDAFATAHRDEWDRLSRLTAERRLSGVEADALIEGYQAGAAQLSVIKANSADSAYGDRLSLILSRARMRFTGAQSNILRRVPDFLFRQLPAALHRIRWWSLGVTVGFVLLGLYFALWGSLTPGVLDAFAPEELRRQIADDEFVGYYSEHGEAEFSAIVWSNNAYIAMLTVALGITGIGPVAIIVQNAQSIGLMGAVMAEFGRLDDFFLYILPHGQLELYAVFVAGAAGLRLFWSWIVPGPRTRSQALAEDGRAFVAVAIGLIGALAVSGVIEGFVTRQDWPWVLKIGIGSAALLGFLAYQWILGGRAARSGETGDLGEFEAGARRIIVD